MIASENVWKDISSRKMAAKVRVAANHIIMMVKESMVITAAMAEKVKDPDSTLLASNAVERITMCRNVISEATVKVLLQFNKSIILVRTSTCISNKPPWVCRFNNFLDMFLHHKCLRPRL